MQKLRLAPLCAFVLLASASVRAAEPLGNTLEDFFTAAINYSPGLRAAQERWNIGDARVDFATGQLLPQISASGTVSDNTRSEPNQLDQDYRGRRYGVQLSQVLFNWQAFAARKQASLQENQFEAQYYVQLAQLLTEVADSYLTVLQAEDALRSINTELEAITNQLNQIQRLFDLQLARITDLYNAQAQFASVQTQRITAESDLTIARETLRANTGLGVGALNRLPDNQTMPPLEGMLEDWLARASANNQSISASNYALQVADKTVSMRRGAYMPRVSLVLQRQSSDVGFDNLQLNRYDTNYIGIDFSMPLFAGGSNRAQVREALSQRNMAESELQQVSLDVMNRARTAYFQTKAGEARVEAAKLLAESTATASAAMQRGFELGTETSVNVLNALRDQFRAERDLQKARYDLIRATLVLEREAGTLDAADMQAVSNQLNAPPVQ